MIPLFVEFGKSATLMVFGSGVSFDGLWFEWPEGKKYGEAKKWGLGLAQFKHQVALITSIVAYFSNSMSYGLCWEHRQWKFPRLHNIELRIF